MTINILGINFVIATIAKPSISNPMGYIEVKEPVIYFEKKNDTNIYYLHILTEYKPVSNKYNTFSRSYKINVKKVTNNIEYSYIPKEKLEVPNIPFDKEITNITNDVFELYCVSSDTTESFYKINMELFYYSKK